MRIATYNVHSCIGMDGRCDPARIAFHFNAMIEEVSGRYGDAILSKAPFRLVAARSLPGEVWTSPLAAVASNHFPVLARFNAS